MHSPVPVCWVGSWRTEVLGNLHGVVGTVAMYCWYLHNGIRSVWICHVTGTEIHPRNFVSGATTFTFGGTVPPCSCWYCTSLPPSLPPLGVF